MKKYVLFSVSIFCLFAVCSCGDMDNHHFQMLTGGDVGFADGGRVDSLRFYTMDAWNVESQSEWLRLNDDEATASADWPHVNNGWYYVALNVIMRPNMTGRTRTGRIYVNTYTYQGGAAYVQYPFLNITYPGYHVERYVSGNPNLPDSVSFELRDSTQLADSLCFRVNEGWHLAVVDEGEQTSWLQLDRSQRYGSSGRGKAVFQLEPNYTDQERSCVLRLSVGDVFTDVKVRQLVVKKEEEEEE